MKKVNISIFMIIIMICTGCGSVTNDRSSTVDTNSQKNDDEIVTGTSVSTYTEIPVAQTPALETSITEISKNMQECSINELKYFQPLSQYPELPTGCEVTSLTMVLDHNGLSADKCDIADNFLDKGEVGTVDFRVAFEGDPRDESSYGCYAPVIVKTANRYLQSIRSGLKAYDLSGSDFENLFSYIDANIPVIVWGTLDCAEGYYSTTWNVDGVDLTWYTPEHCMVLIGYDNEMVWVADPVYGDVRSYDREIFRNRYETLYKQAVVIQ